MPENSKDPREERNAFAVNFGELGAKIAHNRLRHGQAHGLCGHLCSSPRVLRTWYEMIIDNQCILQ